MQLRLWVVKKKIKTMPLLRSVIAVFATYYENH
jgi:hypothetical protein